jgi:hypothetical protein
MQPGSSASTSNEASVLKHMSELHPCTEVQPEPVGQARHG